MGWTLYDAGGQALASGMDTYHQVQATADYLAWDFVLQFNAMPEGWYAMRDDGIESDLDFKEEDNEICSRPSTSLGRWTCMSLEEYKTVLAGGRGLHGLGQQTRFQTEHGKDIENAARTFGRFLSMELDSNARQEIIDRIQGGEAATDVVFEYLGNFHDHMGEALEKEGFSRQRNEAEFLNLWNYAWWDAVDNFFYWPEATEYKAPSSYLPDPGREQEEFEREKRALKPNDWRRWWYMGYGQAGDVPSRVRQVCEDMLVKAMQAYYHELVAEWKAGLEEGTWGEDWIVGQWTDVLEKLKVGDRWQIEEFVRYMDDEELTYSLCFHALMIDRVGKQNIDEYSPEDWKTIGSYMASIWDQLGGSQEFKGYGGNMSNGDLAQKAQEWAWHDSRDQHWDGPTDGSDKENWAQTVSMNRDSDLMEQSNFNTISYDMETRFPDDVEQHRFGHWAVGHIDHLFVRIYDANGEYTPAFDAIVEWEQRLADYPVADEDDYSRMELEATFDNIYQAGYSFVKESIPKHEWVGPVYSWLSDNRPEAIENRDDRGGYPSDEEIQEALYALGMLDPDYITQA
jgi:hypothetical protein